MNYAPAAAQSPLKLHGGRGGLKVNGELTSLAHRRASSGYQAVTAPVIDPSSPADGRWMAAKGGAGRLEGNWMPCDRCPGGGGWSAHPPAPSHKIRAPAHAPYQADRRGRARITWSHADGRTISDSDLANSLGSHVAHKAAGSSNLSLRGRLVGALARSHSVRADQEV
jgi:hypothetical protein